MGVVTVIGGGFAGLSAACYMARDGHKVTLQEKNATLGGRARVYSEGGFKFDMGPSWYWMPDVFERFFNDFGTSVTDHYQLVQLDPGFQIIFNSGEEMKVPRNIEDLYILFDSIESGSGSRLRKFMGEARFKYQVGMGNMVYKPSFSWLEYTTPEVFLSLVRLQMLTPVSTVVRKFFKDNRLRALLEFPVLFLGAAAEQIPALYTLMNYAGLELGTWYPMGGMHKIVNAMEEVAGKLGVTVETSSEVSEIKVAHNRVSGTVSNGRFRETDLIIGSGDYHHIEQALLPEAYRTYDEPYWDSRTFAPSCLIFYLGVSKKLKKLEHHNLFFDADLGQHSNEIYASPKWPTDPLFYVCCPSKTDASVAPLGSENLFLLMPIAVGLPDDDDVRERYFANLIGRLESYCNEDIVPYIVHKRSYCVRDFKMDYHAYKGNAYGLANVLKQTAVLKPSMRNKKLPNLFFAGQLTVPGPGMPPALISGHVAAQQAINYFKSTKAK